MFVLTTALAAKSSFLQAAQKEFVVGFDAEFPPYGYLDENGEYVGFDLDLAQEVCDRKASCITVRIYEKINDAVNDVVDHITLADMVAWQKEQ